MIEFSFIRRSLALKTISLVWILMNRNSIIVTLYIYLFYILYFFTNQLQGITNKQTLQDPEMNRVNLGPVYKELGDHR